MNRRSFLVLGLTCVAAPAIVRASSLMAIKPLDMSWPLKGSYLDVDFVNNRAWCDGKIMKVGAWARRFSNGGLEAMTTNGLLVTNEGLLVMAGDTLRVHADGTATLYTRDEVIP